MRIYKYKPKEYSLFSAISNSLALIQKDKPTCSFLPGVSLFKILLILSLSLVFGLKAEPQLKFQKITREDGLATDTLYTVIEDQNGFLWFGGEQGVQRYDGNEFRSFSTHSIDEPKLNDNLVRILLNDHENNIWIGTDNGLNIYNQDRETMSLFDFGLKTDKDKTFRIRSLFQSEDLNIWIGSYGGLTSYNPKTKK